MSNTMEYKGYLGSVEFSQEDALFFGKVLGIQALISYEGENAQNLVEDFHSAVDDYLALCAEEGIEPEGSIPGQLACSPISRTPQAGSDGCAITGDVAEQLRGKPDRKCCCVRQMTVKTMATVCQQKS